MASKQKKQKKKTREEKAIRKKKRRIRRSIQKDFRRERRKSRISVANIERAPKQIEMERIELKYQRRLAEEITNAEIAHIDNENSEQIDIHIPDRQSISLFNLSSTIGMYDIFDPWVKSAILKANKARVKNEMLVIVGNDKAYLMEPDIDVKKSINEPEDNQVRFKQIETFFNASSMEYKQYIKEARSRKANDEEKASSASKEKVTDRQNQKHLYGKLFFTFKNSDLFGDRKIVGLRLRQTFFNVSIVFAGGKCKPGKLLQIDLPVKTVAKELVGVVESIRLELGWDDNEQMNPFQQGKFWKNELTIDLEYGNRHDLEDALEIKNIKASENERVSLDVFLTVSQNNTYIANKSENQIILRKHRQTNNKYAEILYHCFELSQEHDFSDDMLEFEGLSEERREARALRMYMKAIEKLHCQFRPKKSKELADDQKEKKEYQKEEEEHEFTIFYEKRKNVCCHPLFDTLAYYCVRWYSICMTLLNCRCELFRKKMRWSKYAIQFKHMKLKYKIDDVLCNYLNEFDYYNRRRKYEMIFKGQIITAPDVSVFAEYLNTWKTDYCKRHGIVRAATWPLTLSLKFKKEEMPNSSIKRYCKIVSLALNGQEDGILCSFSDGSLKLFDLKSGSCIKTFCQRIIKTETEEENRSSQMSFAFSQKERIFISTYSVNTND